MGVYYSGSNCGKIFLHDSITVQYGELYGFTPVLIEP